VVAVSCVTISDLATILRNSFVFTHSYGAVFRFHKSYAEVLSYVLPLLEVVGPAALGIYRVGNDSNYGLDYYW
jgi:hypothetical protein